MSARAPHFDEQEWLVIGIAAVLLAWGLYALTQPWWLHYLARIATLELSVLSAMQDWFTNDALSSVASERPPTDLSFEQVYYLKALAHTQLLPMVILLSFTMAAATALRSQPRYEGMLSLLDIDIFISRFYYPSRPVVGRSYENRHPISDANCRFARKPWEFAIDEQLLCVHGKPIIDARGDGDFNLARPTLNQLSNLKLDRLRATHCFSHQLGPQLGSVGDTPLDIIRKVMSLPNEYRAVLIALLADVHKQELANCQSPEQWLSQFASSFWDLSALKQRRLNKLPTLSRANLNMTRVDAALEQALQIPSALGEIKATAYANVLLLKLMRLSRLTTAKMLWLKPVNRVLFYTLNNVGRPRRLFVEGHAAHVHEQVETQVAKPLRLPQVKGSIDALEAELINHGWLLACNAAASRDRAQHD